MLSLPRYKRKGHSSLGIDPKKQQIVWEGAPEKKPSHKKPERYYSRSAVQMLRIRAEHVACSKDTTNAASAGFIPVMDYVPDTSSTSAARTSWVNPLGIYDDSTSMWLQGKGGPEDKTSPAAPRDTELLGKVEDYNRRIRENPGDIQTWMEFVSFQDELLAQPSMYSTCEGEVDSYRMSLKLLLEKKLSILDRAIEGNPGSTELKLARLRLCEEFWEAPALLKEWQKLVFLHPNDPQLWQKYLLFSQSHFSTFSVSKVIAVYGKCLSTLAAVQDGSMLSHPVVPGTERSMCGLEEEEDVEEELDIKDKSLPRHKIWLDMESLREARHFLPWRADPDKKQTEEDCEDPERQVLFDDLGPSMFRITSPALKFQLMLSFLQFLGVPCGSRPPAACLYPALDELSLFDHMSA
ncbi:hypothetical protein AB205_0196730, partial [Aquarana catesbeiana]